MNPDTRQHPYAIAGATSDLGMGLAWRLAQQGFALLLIDRDEAKLSQLADELEASGHAEPLLAVINPLQADFETQCQQLAQAAPQLSGFCWAGAWLDQPTPILNESLEHWQKGLMLNVTYPLMLFKSLNGRLTETAMALIAQPQALAFTNQLGAASSLWSAWLPIINQELGTATSPKLKLWQLPRLADRVHRRIYPLAELNEFTPIDTAIDAWLLNWMAY
jgi:NAD(P)-dependent dehydrogenase (short-subunit alcohol dehydrogenase family)